jgi:hypothetical protein
VSSGVWARAVPMCAGAPATADETRGVVDIR